DYTYLHTVSWRRAVNLVLKGKVEVLKYSENMVHGFCRSLTLPSIVRLVKFVRQVYKNKVPLHRKNIFIRDAFTCQYCGQSCRKSPTLDHIIPKSRGGSISWQNSVTACTACNQKKGSRTPREANMALIRQPFQPTINEFTQMKVHGLGLERLLADLLQRI
ncbi:MAG: HNH endonuclease, partial [Desulfovermiculus sp.]